MSLAKPVSWFRAAGQRLEAANLLLDHAIYIDAAYLGGYVVECAFKGFIIARVLPAKRRKFVETRFRGQRAHDIEYLLNLARQLHAVIPIKVVERLRQCSWSTDLRYTAGLGNRDEAIELLDAGEETLTWARSDA
jgi:hypothetical protein